MAADDAKQIVLKNPNDIESLNFAFPDHKEMIFKALNHKEKF